MAVNGVSFQVYPGETLGAGGRVRLHHLGRTLLRLIAPMGGQVLFEGQDLRAISGRQLAAGGRCKLSSKPL